MKNLKEKNIFDGKKWKRNNEEQPPKEWEKEFRLKFGGTDDKIAISLNGEVYLMGKLNDAVDFIRQLLLEQEIKLKQKWVEDLLKKLEDLRKPVLMPGSYKELLEEDKPNQAFNQALTEIKNIISKLK
jgi:hypothetical protein